ncbi:MAG: hypothetical protein KF764_15050 [Labilithrix sp.]|nr:hypothetical protein [Labilithrix sp.]MBX3222492.1 hypothetical protein [Labilithrix sp.]
MTGLRGRALSIGITLAIASAFAVGCDDAADSLSTRGSGGNRGGGANGDGTGDPNDPNDPNNPNRLSPEEVAFRALEGDLVSVCGRTCHDTGKYAPPAPMFLAGPDVYKSVKSHPGIVTRDVYASAFLTKGPHAGPAVSYDGAFEKKVVAWLEAESLAIQAVPLPTTPPTTLKSGANDIDLTPAAIGGLTGVRLKFDAALVGTMLSLSNIVLVAPAGQDVHILQPRFIRVLGTPAADGPAEVADPADSFSNSDQTVPGGASTPLAPGSVLFSNEAWRPFDLAKDKIRIEIAKLEPGKVAVIATAATCKNVQGFVTNVLPSMRGQGGFNLNCANGNCHGNAAIGNINLAGNDNNLICQQVLQKMNQGNIAQSLIVTKPTGANHGGGQLTDANGWRTLFMNNAAVFF